MFAKTRRWALTIAAAMAAAMLLLPAGALAQSYPPSPAESPTEEEGTGGTAGETGDLPQTGGPLVPAIAVGLTAAGGAGMLALRKRNR